MVFGGILGGVSVVHDGEISEILVGVLWVLSGVPGVFNISKYLGGSNCFQYHPMVLCYG